MRADEARDGGEHPGELTIGLSRRLWAKPEAVRHAARVAWGGRGLVRRLSGEGRPSLVNEHEAFNEIYLKISEIITFNTVS